MKQGVRDVMEELDDIQQELASMIMDAQDDAEVECKERNLAFDDFTTDPDGTIRGIVYPENACPELDLARTLVQDAWTTLSTIK